MPFMHNSIHWSLLHYFEQYGMNLKFLREKKRYKDRGMFVSASITLLSDTKTVALTLTVIRRSCSVGGAWGRPRHDV